jgi:hypothetical protein
VRHKRGRLVRIAQRYHLVAVGSGMLTMVALFSLGTNALNWGEGWVQRWNYGPIPTFQVDKAVGHNGDSPAHPSHFIATDSEGRVEVFEVSPDGTKSQFYPINTLYSGNSTSVMPAITLTFQDVNQDGKLDMEIHVAGVDTPLICLNDGTKFGNPLSQ